MCEDGVLDSRFMIYDYAIWGLYDAYIYIGEMSTFLGSQRELFVEPCREVFEGLDSVVGTQEVIFVASHYKNFLGGGCIKGVYSMEYDILYKAYGGEDQVEYCIPLVAIHFSYFHTM